MSTVHDALTTAVTLSHTEDQANWRRVTEGKMTPAEAFSSATMRVGRNHAPETLLGWMMAGRLDDDNLRAVILDVWTMNEFPQHRLGTQQWLEWFGITGFVSECGTPRPTAPLTLYRGSGPTHSRRMSWTTNPEIARQFARRRLPGGTVFTATVPHHAVLAILDHPDGRGEDEVIVNPHKLRGAASPRRLATGETPP